MRWPGGPDTRHIDDIVTRVLASMYYIRNEDTLPDPAIEDNITPTPDEAASGVFPVAHTPDDLMTQDFGDNDWRSDYIVWSPEHEGSGSLYRPRII